LGGGFAVIDFLHRGWAILKYESRPVDWLVVIIDLLVLIVIVCSEIIGWWRHHKQSKRDRHVRKILDKLYLLMEEGRAIMSAVPNPSGDAIYDAVTGEVTEWIKSVGAWNKQTKELLEQISSKALATFELTSETGISPNPQIVYKQSGYSFSLRGLQGQTYKRLVSQLNNLRRIAEKPEAYF
jgi:hypothetical protein